MMTEFFSNLALSFLAGLLAPLTAVCVLPLYPAFLAYLSNQLKDNKDKKRTNGILLGLIVVAGILSSMSLIGLIFTTLLKTSLTNAIGIISPIAFSLLAIISILMIFNINFTGFIPKKNAPILKNPYFTSYAFGFFFGGIIIPCNPASLIVLFGLSTTTSAFISNLFNFILFGLGMGIPLLILSIVSETLSTKIIRIYEKHQKSINLSIGLIMLGISIYYLFFVFKVQTILY